MGAGKCEPRFLLPEDPGGGGGGGDATLSTDLGRL